MSKTTDTVIDHLNENPEHAAQLLTPDAETNRQNAAVLGNRLREIDRMCAELGLVHAGHFRDGEFDLARLRVVRGLLYDVGQKIVAAFELSNQVTPTVALEANAPVEEKEEQS